MLKFQVSCTQKKGVILHVFRRSPVKDPLSSQRYTHKELGSFTISEGCTPALLKQLKPHELILLENWLAEAEFAKGFGIEPEQSDKFEKITLRVPKKLVGLVEKYVYPATKDTGVWFNPARILLDSYKKSTEAAIKKVIRNQGKNEALLKAMKNAGLSLDDNATETHQQRLALESRALFKALLKLEQPIEKTCQELEKFAEKHGKIKKISPKHVRAWAGEKQDRIYELKNWYMSIAIDVLLKHDVDLFSLLPLDKIARYWSNVRVGQHNLKTAQSAFAKLFTLTTEQLSIANVSIMNAYKKAPVK